MEGFAFQYLAKEKETMEIQKMREKCIWNFDKKHFNKNGPNEEILPENIIWKKNDRSELKNE